MGVLDGQDVSAAVTNPAFINKNTDDTTPSKLGLANADVVSGTSVTNTQRELNSISSFTGSVLNSAKDQLPVWTNNNVGSSTDNLKQRAEALTLAFASAGNVRANNQAISSAQNTVSVTFSTPFSANTYAVTCTMINVTDAFPQIQPIVITTKSASGFTATWDQATDSSNYLLSYTAIFNT